MIDFRSDLRDPVSGEQKDPVQQDGWHYDSLTQQMIGEEAIRLINNTDGEQTDYGFIPSQYENAASYPFAVFKKVNGSYTFDSAKTTAKLAFGRARELTAASGGSTKDVVILLRSDCSNGDFPEHVSDIGGTVTFDLGGKTFTGRTSLGNIGVSDCLDANGKQIKIVINIKNGTLLMRDFGVIFNAAGSDYAEHTGEKVFDYNFENVYLGFREGTAGLADGSKGIDLLVSDRSTSTLKNVRFNLNLKDCTLDFVTNAKARASIGRLTTSNMADVSMADYDIKFYGCTFIVSSLSNLGATVSESGDSVTFMKDSDGSFGKIISSASLGASSTLKGADEGVDTSLKLKSLGQTDGKNNYSLVAAGDVKTAYGTISSAYSDSENYPIVVFHKSAESSSYSLVGGYNSWTSAIGEAANKIKGASGATKDDSAVILIRRDFTYSDLYSSTTVIGGTLTIDLGGHTVTCKTSLMNTTSADFSAGIGGSTYVNIKNGELRSAMKYAFIYNRTGAASSYTVPKTYYFNFDNVYFGYTPESTSTKFLIQADATSISDADSIATHHVYNYNNCTIDMSGSPSGAVVAKFAAHSSIEKLNYEVFFKNSRFITDTVSKVTFTVNANGDNVTFLKGTNGKYPDVLIEKKYEEPDSTYKFNGDGNYVLSYGETGTVEGKYKVYELLTGIYTKYGYIDLADANKGFVVFSKDSLGKYTAVGSYSAWSGACAAVASLMNAQTPQFDECVICLTRDIIDSSYPENVSDLAGVLTVDLGGNRFTNKTTLFRTDVDDCMASGESSQKKLTVNVVNGELVFYNFGLLFATAGSTYTTEKTIEFNIENVSFSYAEGASNITEPNKGMDLLVSDRSAPSSVNVYYNFNVKNCTFDLITNARAAARLGNLNTTNSSSDSAKSVYTVVFTDCTFITDDVNKIAFAKSTSGDSVVMSCGSDGKYPTVLVPDSSPEFYSSVFDAEGGKRLSLVYAGTKDGYLKYDMTVLNGAITQSTAYGTITNEYVATSSYPFALFYKDAGGSYRFSAGYNSYSAAMNAAIGLTKSSNASRVSEAVILLRCDWAGGSFPTGTSDVCTKITVDLNGYTLGALESLTNTGTQDSLDPSGNKVATNGVIEYKNGRLLMRSHGLIYAASKGSYTAGYEKTLTFNFNNVYVGFYQGATSISLIGRVASNHTGTTNTININFTDCIFDMVTNRSTNASLVFGNWTASSDYTKVNTVYEDCSFIGNTENDMIAKTKSGNDTVTVVKSEGGNYASLTLPKTAAAPAAEYTTDSGITLAFVKISDDGDTVTYRLRAKELASVDFVPKMSLTLDRSLVLNVYVPAADFLTGFTLDGAEYTNFAGLERVTLGDGEYYLVRISLDAKAAARDVVLKANVNLGEKTATATFTFGIIKYAEKILADGGDVEKTLVRDVLSYVRAAYTYFKTDNAQSVSRIDAILGAGYDAGNAPAEEGSADAETAGLKSATFSLDGEPAMRFYLPDGADVSKYEFFINGTRVKTQTSEDGKYVDIDVYAYALCETVTYTIDGVESGSFHIKAYYEWSKTQSNENLVNLTARFWKYLQSARAYRDSVVES